MRRKAVPTFLDIPCHSISDRSSPAGLTKPQHVRVPYRKRKNSPDEKMKKIADNAMVTMFQGGHEIS